MLIPTLEEKLQLLKVAPPTQHELAYLKDRLVSEWAAANVYRVAYDPAKQRVDLDETARLRAEERSARIARGKPMREFEGEWLKRKPPEEILEFYGSWPEAASSGPLFRP